MDGGWTEVDRVWMGRWVDTILEPPEQHPGASGRVARAHILPLPILQHDARAIERTILVFSSRTALRRHDTTRPHGTVLSITWYIPLRPTSGLRAIYIVASSRFIRERVCTYTTIV